MNVQRDQREGQHTMLEALSAQPIYNVKAVCQRTGITAARLRAWERRYQLLMPNRTGQNYRLYSERDVGLLFWLLNQIGNGVSARNAMARLRALLDSQVTVRVQMFAPPAHAAHDLPRSPEVISDEVASALIMFKGRRADELVQEALALYTIETVFVNILRDALGQVRQIKRDGDTNSAGEQFALNYIRQRTMNMIQTTPIIRGQRFVLLVSFSDEQSEVDLLILSLMLRRQGWAALSLGNDLDLSALTHAISMVDTGVVLFYVNLPANARKLADLPPLYDTNGTKIRTVASGHAAGVKDMDYLGYDLRHITRELQQYLSSLERVPVE